MQTDYSIPRTYPDRADALGVGRLSLHTVLLPPFLLTGVLWLTRLNDVSFADTAAAFVLAVVPWWFYLRWRRDASTFVPLFAAVTLVYWLYFAVTLFWGTLSVQLAFVAVPLAPGSITQTMFMAAVGVLTLAAGKLVGVGRHLHLSGRLDVSHNPADWTYLRIILLPLTVLGFVPVISGLGSGSSREIVQDIFQVVPLVICFLLLERIFAGEARVLDKLLVAAYLVLASVFGVASGAIAPWLFIAVGVLLVYLGVKRSIPRLPVILVLAVFLFFQPGKDAFRSVYVYENGGQQVSAGVLTRAHAWFILSVDAWSGAFTGQSGQTPLDLVRNTIDRTSLLATDAHVVDYTPSIVPYQYGSTYAYLPVSLVPRLIWPDKPSINDANQFYETAYGVTNAVENHNNVSISVGALAEGYMNFGWVGVILIMFFLGILFDWIETTFLARDSGFLFTAFGIVMVLQFILIESQMSVYLSGLIQKAVVAGIVLFPVWRGRRAPEQSGRPQPG